MDKKGNRGNHRVNPHVKNPENASPSTPDPENASPSTPDPENASPSTPDPENESRKSEGITAKRTSAVIPPEDPSKSPFLRFINKYTNVILIVLALLMPLITIPVNKIIDKYLEKPVDKTAMVKEQIEKDVDQIREMLGGKRASDGLNVKGNLVNSFQMSILDLVKYHGVHDISDFEGENFDESCLMVKTNLLERGIYDNDLKTVLFNLDSIYEIDVIKENKFIYLAKQNVSNMATRWLREDSTRNCIVSANLEHVSNSNDSIGFIDALTPLINYKKNLFNYRFQKSFYDHLIRVNRQL